MIIFHISSSAAKLAAAQGIPVMGSGASAGGTLGAKKDDDVAKLNGEDAKAEPKVNGDLGDDAKKEEKSEDEGKPAVSEKPSAVHQSSQDKSKPVSSNPVPGTPW